jgi:hypothetical protein
LSVFAQYKAKSLFVNQTILLHGLDESTAMISIKVLFVLAVSVLFSQSQGQNWVSKCPERPVVKNFDVTQVSFENKSEMSLEIIWKFAVRWQMVRHLSLH